mgnify:CR=1 FL=1|tara:strand:+ start:78 stop:1748 length:1671 start_codon:yes stop_codon:yes gene_type:complete
MAYNPLDFLKNLVPDNINMFGASPNANMRKMAEMGLLGDANYKDMLAKANKQSVFQGLLNTGLAYAAQPKNQGYGSIFPYLAKAGLAGVQAAQSPFDRMGKDAMMNQQLEEMKRAKDLQGAKDLFRKNYPLTGGTTQIDPNQEVPLAPFRTGTLQDDTIGSSLMTGKQYNQPRINGMPIPNEVAPMFDVINTSPMDALNRGVSQDQLSTTEIAPDSELVRAEQAYKAGVITYPELMATKASLAKTNKFKSASPDSIIFDEATGKIVNKGVTKKTKQTRKITKEELTNNTYGKLASEVNGRPAIWYLKDDLPVNINKSEKALVENIIGDKGDNAADSKLSQSIAGRVESTFVAAEAALMSNNSLDDLIGITEEGIYAGKGSDIKLNLVEYGVQFGFIDPDEQEAVKAMGTKAVLQIIAQQQLDEAKANRGQGTLSDAERAIMADARLGRIDTTNKEQLAMLAHTLKKLNAYKVVYHFDRLKAARNALPESDNRLNYYSQIGKYNAGNIDELRQSLTRKAKLQTVDGQQQFVVNDEVQNLDVSEIGNVVSGGRFLGFN